VVHEQVGKIMSDPNGGFFSKIVVAAVVTWEWVKNIFTKKK
jgi:hypothetical protein